MNFNINNQPEYNLNTSLIEEVINLIDSFISSNNEYISDFNRLKHSFNLKMLRSSNGWERIWIKDD